MTSSLSLGGDAVVDARFWSWMIGLDRQYPVPAQNNPGDWIWGASPGSVSLHGNSEILTIACQYEPGVSMPPVAVGMGLANSEEVTAAGRLDRYGRVTLFAKGGGWFRFVGAVRDELDVEILRKLGDERSVRQLEATVRNPLLPEAVRLKAVNPRAAPVAKIWSTIQASNRTTLEKFQYAARLGRLEATYSPVRLQRDWLTPNGICYTSIRCDRVTRWRMWDSALKLKASECDVRSCSPLSERALKAITIEQSPDGVDVDVVLDGRMLLVEFEGKPVVFHLQTPGRNPVHRYIAVRAISPSSSTVSAEEPAAEDLAAEDLFVDGWAAKAATDPEGLMEFLALFIAPRQMEVATALSDSPDHGDTGNMILAAETFRNAVVELAAQRQEDHNATKYIVVVEDNQALLSGLERKLTTEFPDYEVVVAISSKEALKKMQDIQERGVAAFIADQRMPDQTGLEFLAETQARHPSAVKILYTAFKMHNDETVRSINEVGLTKLLDKNQTDIDGVAQVLRESLAA